MKQQLKFLLSSLTIASFISLSPLTACQSNGLFISTSTFTFLTSNRFIDIPIEFHDIPNSEVYVEIENDPDNLIHLEQNIFNVSTRNINLHIKLDDSVTNDQYINFDLAFWIKKPRGKKSILRLCDFVYYYQIINPETDDQISVPDTTSTSVNKHFFMYDLYFDQIPDSNAVKVELLDDTSNMLKLRQHEFPIECGTGTKARIILDLDIGIYQNQAFPFNLKFTFTNSKHIEQNTTLYGFVGFFIKKQVDEVPEEYLDLVLISNEKNDDDDEQFALKGIKKGVDSRDLVSYTKLVVPDNVVRIEQDAFAQHDLLPNITSLTIPNSVEDIEMGAFSGLDTIDEIDLSSYEELPQWASEGDKRDIFSDNMTFQFGFVWTSKSDLNISEKLWEKGLPNNWKDYAFDCVTGKDFYKFDDVGRRITGISEDGLDQLEKIKVIKIPDHVKSIDPDVFAPIKKTPFKGKEGPETRLLFLNSELESLPNGIFKNAGISGPIIINSPYISSLSESAFEECSVYDDPLITGVKEDSNKSIYFIQCNNLTSIQNYAFSMFKASSDNLSLPHNIKEIGDLAFQQCSCKTITIPHSVSSIGTYAFADIYSDAPQKRLSKIDLSDYDEILNPEEEESQQTYIPSWLVATDSFTFLNACADSGVVILSNEIKQEVEDNNENWNDWVKKIKKNHGIPMNNDKWKFECS